METWQLIDKVGGQSNYLVHDDVEQQYRMVTQGDPDKVLERNKALRNQGNEGYGETRELRHVASIPVEIQMKWFADYGVKAWKQEDMPKVLKLLDDPDWCYLKTINGRINHRV